jgi:DNA-binding NarL/FixJ family response regulator
LSHLADFLLMKLFTEFLTVSGPVRVLLLELPHLLRDILEHAIKAQDDCELLTDMAKGFETLTKQIVPPDIVVLGLTEAQDATLVAALLARWPQTRVLTVMQSGDDATVYELRPHSRVFREISPSGIVHTLCQAVHESRALSGE